MALSRKFLLSIILLIMLSGLCFAESGWQGTYVDDLTDVDAPTPTDGDVLVWDSLLRVWKNGSIDLTSYYKLDGSNANNYLYLTADKYLKKIDDNTVGLYIHDTLITRWENIPATPEAGSYMGFGAFTYS